MDIEQIGLFVAGWFAAGFFVALALGKFLREASELGKVDVTSAIAEKVSRDSVPNLAAPGRPRAQAPVER
jgi:hypothetical protein